MLVLSITVMAQSTKKVALLETLNGDKRVQVEGIEMNMVRGELRKAISLQDGYRAFTRTDIDQLMKEYGFQNSGMVSDDQRKRLGDMSGADYICVSTLTKNSTQFYLEAYLIEVSTGEISNPATQFVILKDGTYADLFQLCQNLAKELIGDLEPTIRWKKVSQEIFEIDGVEYMLDENEIIEFKEEKDDFNNNSIITIKVGNVSFDMVKVEAGSFIMGCTDEQVGECDSDERPYHRVTITQDYYIGKFEVTQELYEAVMGVNPSNWKAFDRPVENVSWNDAQEFCNELRRMTGRRFRLPTEAEWEYAARGGKKSTNAKYSGSSSVANVAWYDGNSGSQTHPVGRLRANELGIYDMSGNVWEWCYDWYGNYSSGSQTDPMGPGSGSDRVNRGGGWLIYAGHCRVSDRGSRTPSFRDDYLGFRVVLVP